ncbi:MAG: proline--tRNA ligase [Sedimentisphaerales bacterium]|nr:proline--tRNA ligase [Sedimentisphaerales bacterium]MBN2842201.1 proline--tRNA ligase [Sedimentisphaerales bacterium]
MKLDKFILGTVKEVPSDAEISSHQLMIRAGMIRKVASGTYAYLPLGLRVIHKIIEIVRQEMDAAGAQEVLLPIVQPMELWQATGRDQDYGQTLGYFTDRHGRENVLSPTAEEVMTVVGANEISSYKQLPVNLYQINTKYRDEFRPRFGVLRSREFIMKDAYSFDADEIMLEQSYRNMYNAYCNVFKRCGVEYVIVEAEAGEMGGSGSHQFTVPCESGEDVIVYTEDLAYAANIEKAAVDPLSPEAKPADIQAITEIHTPGSGAVESVCAFLKTTPDKMIKCMIYVFGPENKTLACLVRGDHELNPEKLTQALGGTAPELAPEDIVERLTGAKIGYAGPVGLFDKVDRVFIDHGVAALAVGYAGANKTEYHIGNVVPGRDFPLAGADITVLDIRNAAQGDTWQGKRLLFKRGIEVGQVFKLGDKYSKKLGAEYLDESGKRQTCLMGCYGIGINRIMASAIELSHDADGIIWPISIAPFEVLVTTANPNDEQVAAAAEKIYQELLEKDIDVAYDDRNQRAGVKFKDADLIGIPLRITVGRKTLDNGQVEIKVRRQSESQLVDLDMAVDTALDKITELWQELIIEED